MMGYIPSNVNQNKPFPPSLVLTRNLVTVTRKVANAVSLGALAFAGRAFTTEPFHLLLRSDSELEGAVGGQRS